MQLHNILRLIRKKLSLEKHKTIQDSISPAINFSKKLLIGNKVHNDPGAQPASYTIGTGGKNERRFTLPPYAFMA